MKEAFDSAAMAILHGDHAALRSVLNTTDVATHRAANGHPTLLQMVACEEPHVPEPAEATHLLVDAGAETTGPLIAAAGCNAETVLTTLLELGVSVDADHQGWTPLDEALYWNNADIAKLLVRRGASLERLRRAAGLGDLEAIAGFFHDSALTGDAGPIGSPFPDTLNDTEAVDPKHIVNHAFVLAVNCGQTAAAQALHRRGAEINAVPPGYHWKGTALHAAAWRGEMELVQWLLEVGADPSLKDGLANANALGWARHHGHDALVELFE